MTNILFINNVGGMEVIVILLFVLMFFGAKSIPGLARTLGKGMREIQHASDEIKREIRSTSDNIKKDLELGDQVNQIVQDIEQQPRQLLDQIEDEVAQTKRSLEQHAQNAPPVSSKSQENDKPEQA
jgi:sec-independent protein translocase protein TatA